jgi:hypothetical protein
MSIRPRDRSADNVLLTMPLVPTPVQRSISFKRPQEITERKFISRSIFQIKKKDEEEQNDKPDLSSKDIPYFNDQINLQNSNSTQSLSSREHIYDNLDLFKRHKINVTSDILSNDNKSSIVQTREHAARLRPVTMLIPTTSDKQSINEFGNVFEQLKKKSSIRKDEETISVPLPEEHYPYIPLDERPSEKEPIEIDPLPANRRKTVGGVNLPGNNKIAVDDHKPTPSWIDIAKQKQNKL